MVSYDGTVRNSNRHLVQLSYGEDGMDGAFMEFQQLPGIKPSNSSFKRRFYFDCSDQRCLYDMLHTNVYTCTCWLGMYGLTTGDFSRVWYPSVPCYVSVWVAGSVHVCLYIYNLVTLVSRQFSIYLTLYWNNTRIAS